MNRRRFLGLIKDSAVVAGTLGALALIAKRVDLVNKKRDEATLKLHEGKRPDTVNPGESKQIAEWFRYKGGPIDIDGKVGTVGYDPAEPGSEKTALCEMEEGRLKRFRFIETDENSQVDEIELPEQFGVMLEAPYFKGKPDQTLIYLRTIELRDRLEDLMPNGDIEVTSIIDCDEDQVTYVAGKVTAVDKVKM